MSEESKGSILKILQSNNNTKIDAVAAIALERYGIKYEDQPELWQAIANNLKVIVNNHQG